MSRQFGRAVDTFVPLNRAMKTRTVAETTSLTDEIKAITLTTPVND